MSLEVIPEIDTYVFAQIKAAATHGSTTTPTKSNAYELLLAGQESLGNCNVPDAGRVCLCTYAFAGFLKQDPAFMRDCDVAQNNLIKGYIGEVDGLKIVRVPSARMPANTNFIITHPIATVAPKILNEYKIHTDAPGISGWLCEGRFSYDCFVLNNKKDAIYVNASDFSDGSLSINPNNTIGASTDILGKVIGDLETDVVFGDHYITGTLKEITSWSQSGFDMTKGTHFLGFKVTAASGATIKACVDPSSSGAGWVTVGDDGIVVSQINNVAQDIKIQATLNGVTEEKTYSLAKVVLA